jgi:hypothetical protein
MVQRRNTSMPLEPHELDKIATVTLAHYEQHAEEFRAGTRDPRYNASPGLSGRASERRKRGAPSTSP